MLHIRVGDAYRLDKEFEKAKERYNKVLEVDSKNHYAIYGLKKIREIENKK